MMRITIRQLVADDTTGLMGCFQRCYGESYANELFYDEAKLYAAISAGQLRSVVAVNDDVVVGHTGLTIRYDHRPRKTDHHIATSIAPQPKRLAPGIHMGIRVST